MLTFSGLFYTTWDTKVFLSFYMNHIETTKKVIREELNLNIKKLNQLAGGSINSVFLCELEILKQDSIPDFNENCKYCENQKMTKNQKLYNKLRKFVKYEPFPFNLLIINRYNCLIIPLLLGD